jgi:hypothetical protein
MIKLIFPANRLIPQKIRICHYVSIDQPANPAWSTQTSDAVTQATPQNHPTVIKN